MSDETLLELAQKAYAENRIEDAERACRGALDMNPEEPRALTLLGGILMRQGENEEAVRILSQSTEIRPGDITALLWLSEALLRVSRPKQASEVLQKALTLEPDNMLLLKMAGRAFMAYGDIGRAGECFHRCLQQEKDHPPALLGLGICFYKDGLYRQAVEALSRFLEFDPEHLSGRIHLANSLLHNGHFSEAETEFQRVAGLPGGETPALQGLVATAVELVQPELAEERLAKFEQAGGDPVRAAAMRARIASMTGRDDEARQNLRFIIKQQPEQLDAWVQLVSMGPEYVDDGELQLLTRLANRMAGKRRAQALFALARVHEYREDRRKEVEVLHQANEARAMGHARQVEQELAVFKVMEEVCDRDWLESLAECDADDGLRPVFICGMPRSGTTLTEQILSSHPEVTAAGESHASYHAVLHAGRTVGEEALPAVLRKDPARLPALIREGYRKFLAERHGIERGVFTDKSMWLLPYLPLLYKAFPNAVFIHVHRQPLDVTFGCYKQLFTNGQEFSYTVKGCAAYYARSERLMARYRELLPGIHDLAYESLVADQEGVSRELLAWAGLPWDESVLAFHKNKRAVSTASGRQVRQGLFKGASGRWKRYGHLLDPFRDALAAEGVEVPPAENIREAHS